MRSREGHIGSVAEINLTSEVSSSETHQSSWSETLDPLRDGASALVSNTSAVGSFGPRRCISAMTVGVLIRSLTA